MHVYFLFCNIGSSLNVKSSTFWDVFICDYLAKHAEADLVTVKLKAKERRSARRLFCLNDIDRISELYCNFKEKNGKTLKKDPKKRKDNLKNILAINEKEGRLTKCTSGTHYDNKREYLKYEVNDDRFWNFLERNYTVQRTPRMVLQFGILLKLMNGAMFTLYLPSGSSVIHLLYY